MQLDYSLNNPAILALGGMVTALLGGRFLRRLVMLPWEYWARRSGSPVAEALVREAETDLGLDSPSLPTTTTKES